MSEENIGNTTQSDSNFAPFFVYHHVLPELKVNGNCLIKNNNFISKKLINLYTSYIFKLMVKKFKYRLYIKYCNLNLQI